MSVSAKPDRPRSADVGLRRKAAVLTCVIAIIGLVLGALFGDRGILRLIEKRRRAQTMEQEIARLEADNRRLAGEIQALKNDPRAIETIAREDLGLARPGETVFLIQSPDTP